ncbi:MAG: WecB/TagA/CpsF family glycosyltransferase [Methylococcaceae bacterium]
MPWLYLAQSALPRIFDLLTSLSLLLFLLPLLFLRGLLAYTQTGLVFRREIQLGYFQQEFERLSFAGSKPGKEFAVLLNVLRGDLAWAGPRAISPEELSGLPAQALFRFGVRPGVISPYTLRKKIGLAYDDELATDHEFYYGATAKEHVGVSLRGVVGSVLGGNEPRPAPPILHFWGVDIVNTTMAEALDWIEQRIRQKQKALLAFVNPDCLNIAYTHQAYREVLQTAERVLPDGIGINIGCRMLNESLLANINGTDMFPRLCERAAQAGHRLFLLGGLPGVAELAASAMQERYPELLITGVHDGFFDDEQEAQVIKTINNSGADILLVGFGAPKQELWLSRNRGQIQATVCLGIGGLFDYYSGRIARAPVWLREIGLEWTWRLIQEPGRMWKRYIIGNPLFLYRVWLQRQQGPKPEVTPSNTPDKQTSQELQRELLNRYSRVNFFKSQVSFRLQLKRLLWLTVVQGAYLVKRIIDVVASVILLIVLMPVFLIIMVLIYLSSPGPVFYKQTRVGRWGKLFTMWKFRSMYPDADIRLKEMMAQNEMTGGVIFKMKNDPRIIPIGRFIRKASIDELPQLWNVFKGDMSLVGPRPALPSEVNQYSLQDRQRLEVIPGITCIWQVSGRSDIPFPQQVKLDVEYIQSQSLLLDLNLLLRTIPAVLLSRGAY